MKRLGIIALAFLCHHVKAEVATIVKPIVHEVKVAQRVNHAVSDPNAKADQQKHTANKAQAVTVDSQTQAAHKVSPTKTKTVLEDKNALTESEKELLRQQIPLPPPSPVPITEHCSKTVKFNCIL